MLGHAVGDALGVPVEFYNRDSLKKNPVTDMRGFGTHNVPAGCWSDDTSMSICALESLSTGIVNYDDIMQNFCKWYFDEEFTATGETFDIGNTCYDAIYNYSNLGHSAFNCGRSDERSNGNGSLMRIHPFVLYAYYQGIEDEDEFVNMIKVASSLTHAHVCSIDGCVIYAYILRELLNIPEKESVFKAIASAKKYVNPSLRYNRLLNNNISVFSEESIKSGGYIVDSLEAALWCLLTTDNYKDCVLKAVNLGEDTDTVAAIAGGLAGALYGINSIPQQWLETLKKKNYIENMCETAYKNWSKNENKYN